MGGLLIGAAIVVLGGFSLLYCFQGAMIFFPQPLSETGRNAFAPHEIRIPRGDVELHGWFVRREITDANPLIVYYGGNAEEVSGNLWSIERFENHALLFMNYRGYGDSQGRPSEPQLFEDALHILDTVMAENGIDPSHVVLMGRSLGSGVAVHVASRRPVRGIILITPFDSLVAVARRHYPLLPVGLLLRHRFDSVSAAPMIQTPVLNLVAERDEIIPRSSSIRLADQWGGPVRTVIIEDATHNDIESYDAYWAEIRAFLKEVSRRK